MKVVASFNITVIVPFCFFDHRLWEKSASQVVHITPIRQQAAPKCHVIAGLQGNQAPT